MFIVPWTLFNRCFRHSFYHVLVDFILLILYPPNDPKQQDKKSLFKWISWHEYVNQAFDSIINIVYILNFTFYIVHFYIFYFIFL